MCGIALILSVVPVNRPDVNGDSPPHPSHDHKSAFSVDDLNANLLRRGPDCLGEKNVLINLAYPNHLEKDDELSDSSMKSGSSLSGSETSIFVSDIDDKNKLESANSFAIKENNAVTFPFAFSQYSTSKWRDYALELHFIGATLHLRGFSPVLQPLVDASGNFLLYNGEIFGGIGVDIDKNDGEALLHALQTCSSFDCHCQGKYRDCTFKQELHVPYILSTVRGPWALIYWQARSKTLWFGRDAIGRRSLLIHWPTFDKPQFVLSSVSPSSKMNNSGSATDNSFEMARNNDNLNLTSDIYDWNELPCGIYSMYLGNLKYNIQGSKQSLVGNVKKHDWTDPLLKKLTHWERKHVDSECKLRYSEKIVMATQGLSSCQSDTLPYKVSDKDIDFLAFTEDSSVNGVSSYSKEKLLLGAGEKLLANKVLIALQKSVMRRTISSTIFQNAEKIESVPIAILFSGGLDSMLLAALLDRCLYSSCTIDLLNVSFDGASAPDRVSARTGLKELQRISPSRRWQLVEIDAELSNLMSEMKHLMSLIYPSNTYMDLNIGIALWLAARGEGVVHEKMSNYPVPDSCRSIYKSNARILLVGSGADEQCAGYGRHRTKFKAGGWTALEEEMKLDMQRIWKRNLGRDDRCISDHGKEASPEARFPFLDEDVIETLLDIPLKDIANLNEPVGKGDKKILREVAKLLGLEGAAVLPKRAIQFGSRIARESNRKNFGSNRAANQASAGSVVIGKK